jgi:hypothetical protein
LLDVEEGKRVTAKTCIRRFEAWARPQIRGYEVKLGELGERETTWRDKPVVIRYVDGHVDMAFSRKQFSAAYAAYPAYPNACLIYAMAAPWREQRELAQKVRDRWVAEAFEQMLPLTPTRPYRKE